MTRASRLEIFVEEPSAREAIQLLVPKIRDGLEFHIHEFQGCHDLLGKLPQRFRGYASWLPDDWRIAVLIDRDRKDCVELKREIQEMAQRAGLRVQTERDAPAQVLVRIAIEELESWFFGDISALRAAFPGVPRDLAKQEPYRDPDAIRDTWEHLEKVLQRAGHFRTGLQKIRCAREIAAHMDPAVNRSKSFCVFRDGLLAL